MKQEIAGNFRYIYLEQKQWQRLQKQLELLNPWCSSLANTTNCYRRHMELYLLHRLPGTDVLKLQENTLTDPLADVLART